MSYVLIAVGRANMVTNHGHAVSFLTPRKLKAFIDPQRGI